MKSNFKVFLKGITDVSPLMIPVVPFGLIFGVLAIEIGFTPFETMGMSLIIFGGASQIVLLQLFSGGASSLVIISSVGAVNSRHLLYGAVVSEHLSDLKLVWKILISYFLVDQAFARSNEYFKKNNDHNKYFHLVGGGATCWVIWQTTTFLGIVLGSFIPEKLGLSFAVPLTFLALLVNDFRKFINVIVIIVSGLVATLGYNYIPFKAYAIVAGLTGLLIAIILTKMVKKMSNWALIIYCGLITYLTRFSMIALIKKEMFNDRVRQVLSYVPSAIFPAIIFPAIFLDNSGSILIENNPKIMAAIIATIIGIFSRSIIATIFSGLASYWFIIFVI